MKLFKINIREDLKVQMLFPNFRIIFKINMKKLIIHKNQKLILRMKKAHWIKNN